MRVRLAEVRGRLVEWGKENYRPFPWRETGDPYRVLVAEVLLHRTRAVQVVPVYSELVRRCPDPVSLAGMPFDELAELLRPLGLRWRVRLLHQMALELVERYGGRVPCDREALRSLPGVSDYIAGAVLCLAFGVREPVLDTNTVRVVGRLFGLRVTDGSRRSRCFREVMRELLDPEDPRASLLAVLDFAALVCRPVDPECLRCPVRQFCVSGES